MNLFNFQAAVAPNSWAVICLWRNYFVIKDEKEEQHVEKIAEALAEDIGERDDCPIRCPDVAAQRRQFVQDSIRRGLVVGGDGNGTTKSPLNGVDVNSQHFYDMVRSSQNEQEARLAANQPNLSIPTSTDNDDRVVLDSMYFAQ